MDTYKNIQMKCSLETLGPLYNLKISYETSLFIIINDLFKHNNALRLFTHM